MKRRIEALVFDVDGTLAETEHAHLGAFNDAFHAAALPWRWSVEQYTSLLQVPGSAERLRHYIAGFHPELARQPDFEALVRELNKAKNRSYADRVARGHVPLRPGVARLLEEARRAEIRLAIASTAAPQNIQTLLEANLGSGALARFEVVAAGKMVEKKKPAPDVYERVLQTMGLAPRACIAFEDSDNGVDAARAAGIVTVVTVSDFTRSHRFKDAAIVLDHLGEPERACTVLRGNAHDCAMVDVAFLNRLLAAAG